MSSLYMNVWIVYRYPHIFAAEGVDRRHVALRTAFVCTLGLLVMLFGMYGIGFNAEAFIYSRF